MRAKRVSMLLCAAAATMLAGLSGPATVIAAPGNGEAKALGKSKYANSVYIVQMSGDPVVAYAGGVKGYAATKPRKGEKIDPNSGKVARYADYLTAGHDAALSKVGGKKLYSYVYAYNGFAAELTDAEAQKLSAMKGVLAVTKDELRTLDTSSTPKFLGLLDSGSLWEQVGGVGSAGEDIIIGIVDGGAWPEHPSFSDRTGSNGNGTQDGKLSYQQIPGWHGKCVPGEAFTASNCNQKLIGARYYNAGFGGNAGIDELIPHEFNSPRDWGGHGTHTATTAGGNNGVMPEGDAAVFGPMSGIAPRARIAAYKVCWDDGTGGSCFNSDSVAAIDQAVADGVDVINFSISGTRTNFLDPVEVAFLYAADAGVFVAASAGNSGPGATTVAHPSPWITTVAASTHDRYYEAKVVLGDGREFVGASVNQTGAGPAELVYSSDVGLQDADPVEVQLCYPGTLDPALVTGKIVLCDRGVIARVDKSLAVAQAGGIGSILANVTPASLNGDFHSVPTVHVDDVAGAEIRIYADAGGGTAEILPAYSNPAPAPFIASFSSRGPLIAGDGDMLKPDLTAPGVDVLAGVAPPGNGDQLFSLYSGTSMSSPHVAGLAALLTDLHPDWSPMMIKSALMTSGYDVLDNVSTTTKIFRQGAGHVRPNSAADPGLVFDAGWIDWLGFLCGTGQLTASYCPAIGIDPSDLNVPSIAIGNLPGIQTVTRTVTNVGAAGVYTPSVTGMAGIEVSVNPASLDLSAGESATFEVTFTRTTAPLNAYTGGFLTWSDGIHDVRLPMVVKPIEIGAQAQVNGNGVEGSTSFPVVFGYDGDYIAGAHGLVPALQTAGNVADDPGNSFVPFGPGTTLHMITVPPGQAYARFSLFDDYTDGNDDLDLYVYYPNGSSAGGSGSGTSAEEVNVLFPPPGDYYVFVHGWQTDGADANYTLFSWSFSATPGSSNMTIDAPSTVTTGQTADVGVSWTGLDAGTKYLGAVSHSTSGGLVGLTVVSVATD
jgi:hypothetical protein